MVLCVHITIHWMPSFLDKTEINGLLTSWHGNTFCITVPLWGDPLVTKLPVMLGFTVFVVLSLKKQLNKQSTCRWFRMPCSMQCHGKVAFHCILYMCAYMLDFILSWSNPNKSSLNAYSQTSNIKGTLVGNKIVDHSDVVGASPVGIAPTTSSFST